MDPYLCTHVIFSFLGIDSNGNINFMERGESAASAAIQGALDLRSRNPNLKLLAAIGGWSDAMVYPWSNLASNSGARSNLANNILSILQRFNLNGIDIDWEYPNRDQDRPQDKQNFISLLRDIKNKLGSTYSLSIAIGVGSWRTGLSYNVQEMFQICDFVNVMTYDMHGGWEHKTGLHSALYRGSYDNTASNVDESVRLLLNFGVDRSKIIVGIPTYGYRFQLDNAGNNGIGAPANYHPSRNSGYREICKGVRSGLLSVRYDEQQKAPYGINGNEWIGYDNVRSVTEKAYYIKNNGFGGAMFWSLDMDDYDGVCSEGRFPLISTVSNIVKGSGPSPTQPTQPQTSTTQAPSVTTTTTRPSGTFSCPSSNGFYRDPFNCSKYYQCANWNPYHFDCPAGLKFNIKTQNCDWDYNVQC